MRQIIVMFGLIGLSLASFLTLPASAQGDVIVSSRETYAAIAYSPETGEWGYAYNHSSRWSAEAAALKNCRGSDARIVTWVNNGFCALALGDDKGCWGTGYSFGNGASNIEARNRALAQCAQRTKGGRVVLCVCSANARPEVNPHRAQDSVSQPSSH